MPTAEEILVGVEAHLLTVLGQDSGRASVTFLGTERYDVLRFGPDPDGLVRYVTVGMSRAPLVDPAQLLTDPVGGPRAELVLSLHGHRDEVARSLALLAAGPAVEGLVPDAGSGVDMGEPLWSGARVSAALFGHPGGLIPDLELPPPCRPVRFLPVLPMTATEAAYKRVHGAAALEELWLREGTDLRDPHRRGVRLP